MPAGGIALPRTGALSCQRAITSERGMYSPCPRLSPSRTLTRSMPDPRTAMLGTAASSGVPIGARVPCAGVEPAIAPHTVSVSVAVRTVVIHGQGERSLAPLVDATFRSRFAALRAVPRFGHRRPVGHALRAHVAVVLMGGRRHITTPIAEYSVHGTSSRVPDREFAIAILPKRPPCRYVGNPANPENRLDTSQIEPPVTLGHEREV